MKHVSKPLIVAAMLCLLNTAFAQYTELWSSPSSSNFAKFCYIGCENTDSDNAKEVVFVRGVIGDADIVIIDGLSGIVEWTLTPAWYWIHSSDYSDNGGMHQPAQPKLVDVNNDGIFEILFFGYFAISDSARYYLYGYSGATIGEGQNPPHVYQEISLTQNHPNPATSVTTIQYSLTKQADVILKIYNVAGQLVRTLVEGKEKPGVHTVDWDCRDDKGSRLTSGSYFYQLVIDDQQQTKKMITVR
jgi:hypothetical protein